MIRALIATAALFVGSTAAQAEITTLTFDDLTGSCYGAGAGCPVLPNMGQQSRYAFAYTSGDYRLTFEGGSHISDGTNVPQTFNWRVGYGDDDYPTNYWSAYVTVTRIDGGTFDLLSFDHDSDNGFFMAYGTGRASPLGTYWIDAGPGTSAGLFNVTGLDFFGAGSHQIDNLVLSSPGGVPEPATWAMMLAGFGAMGYALRHRSKVRSKVSFA